MYIISLAMAITTILSSATDVQAQRRGFTFINRPDYDYRPYHFGFSLGANVVNFAVRENDGFKDDFDYILPEPALGFNIGIVSNLKLTEYLDLRFIPTLVFADDRYVEYYQGDFDNGPNHNHHRFAENDPGLTQLDLPLLLKYKSERISNTRAYVIGGLKYSYDFASTENKAAADGADELYARIARNDIHYELGVGFDHYFYYFKFSTELKASFGLLNLLREGNKGAFYIDPISRVNARSIMISFLFE